MPRHFTKVITIDELKELIWDAKNEASSYGWNLKSLTPTIEKDLKKVHFDTENIDQQGYETLPNGLTYLGVSAGGDWEIPVFFIIYYDGKKLRGYIPKKGNLWNTDTKRSYGCEPLTMQDDDEAMREGDNKNAVKRGLISAGEDVMSAAVDYDFNLIHDDIQERIRLKN